MPENLLTHKIGPLPVVVWVGAGASIIGLFLLLNKNGSNSSSTGASTNNVSMLAPTEAEAFGTIEQQQQDVTNALTTLGQNQAAVGANVNSLSGAFGQQSAYENTQFGSLSQAMAGLSQQQSSDTSSLEAGQSYYYSSLLQNLINAYNALSAQGTQQTNQISGQVSADQAANNAYYNQLSTYLANMQQGLGGSIGTTKAEILQLAKQFGPNVGGQVQQTLTSRGDYTTS